MTPISRDEEKLTDEQAAIALWRECARADGVPKIPVIIRAFEAARERHRSHSATQPDDVTRARAFIKREHGTETEDENPPDWPVQQLAREFSIIRREALATPSTEWVMAYRRDLALLLPLAERGGRHGFVGDEARAIDRLRVILAAPTPPSSTGMEVRSWPIWFCLHENVDGPIAVQFEAPSEQQRSTVASGYHWHHGIVGFALQAPSTGMEVVREWEEWRKRPADEQSPFALAVRGDRMAAALGEQAAGFEARLQAALAPEQQKIAAQSKTIEGLTAERNHHNFCRIAAIGDLERERATVAGLRADNAMLTQQVIDHAADVDAAIARATAAEAEVERLTGLRATDNKTWIMRAELAESERDTARERAIEECRQIAKAFLTEAPDDPPLGMVWPQHGIAAAIAALSEGKTT